MLVMQELRITNKFFYVIDLRSNRGRDEGLPVAGARGRGSGALDPARQELRVRPQRRQDKARLGDHQDLSECT